MSRSTVLSRLATLALVPLAACGDDPADPPIDVEEGPVYVMMTQVYTVDDRTIYFSTTDTLDISSVSFADATEAPSVANFSAIGGKLYISSGEEPKITQYDVLPDRSLSQTGEISFGAFPLGDNANFYYHYVIDESLAYLPYETTKRIAWSPQDMTILSDETASTMPLTDGPRTLYGGGNRTAVKYPEGVVLQPFYFADETFSDLGTSSRIARYDTATHEESSVLTAPCIGLTLSTRDEAGTTYVSSDAYSPIKKLYGVGEAPCVVRVTASGELDTAWTNDLSALTGGRYAMNFRYLANGLAIANVLDPDALGLDFTQPYDPAVETMIYEPGMFELWLFDLEANTAKPIEGIDLPVSSGGQTAVIDGRMFLFVVFDDYGMTRAYELSEAGVATPKFDVAGDVFKWERLR
jgi:hypothetical protein